MSTLTKKEIKKRAYGRGLEAMYSGKERKFYFKKVDGFVIHINRLINNKT